MKNKISILLLLAMALLLYFCAKQPVAPDKTPDGLRKISLSSSATFNDNSGVFLKSLSQFNNAINRKAPTDAPQSLSKQEALIQFREARVMVMNATSAFRHWAGLIGNKQRLTDYYCQVDLNNYKAFFGKDLDKWDVLVASMSQYLGLELVYNGSLQKSGSTVEGDILVKPGLNMIFVCYIDNTGRIFWTSGAEYVYEASVLADLNLDSASWDKVYQETEGWIADTQYTYNPRTASYDSVVAIHKWEDGQFSLQPSYSYNGCPTYNYYYLPKMGYLGVSKEYADCNCQYTKRQDSLLAKSPAKVPYYGQ